MSGGEVTMHELDDERPIPLGRAAATAATRDAEGNRGPLINGWSAAAELESRSPAHIEKTRVVPAAVEPAPAQPAPVALADAPAGAPPGVAAATRILNAPADHPLAALRGVRMEVEVTEFRRPRGCLRDLGCFLAAWVLVVGFVLALIAAFNALTTQLGGAHP